MKKFLLLFTLSISIVFIISRCGDDTAAKEQEAANKEKESSIHRGEYLVHNVAGCLDCHSNRDFRYFGGPLEPGTEGMGGTPISHELLSAIPGTLYPRNITSDTATGIGGWTDEELFRAITQGISKKGDTLFPLMPYPNYNKLAKQDVLDIIAFIRTLKPVHNEVPQRQLFMPVSMAYPQGLNASLDNNVKPRVDDKIKYGEYLVNMANCAACHTPMNEKGERGDYLSGGNTFRTPGFVVTTANITPDSATGIGAWTEEMFVNKFKTYRDESAYLYDPKDKNSMMPWPFFARMDDADLQAIYAYLHTVKPVAHKVDKYPVMAMK